MLNALPLILTLYMFYIYLCTYIENGLQVQPSPNLRHAVYSETDKQLRNTTA